MNKMHNAMAEELRSEDRISGLPDEVLGHILSYVTTKESVRTSILSKRWSLVWSYVPVIRLDDSSLFSPDPSTDQAMHSSFIRFLNNVSKLYKAGSLQKLTLKCCKFDPYHVSEWVMAAMKHRVPQLDLCITKNEHFKIGVPLFVYQDLVDLKLGKKFVLDIPGEVHLPCLKILHLDSVQFSNDESCHKLLSSCPVLEYLHLCTCSMHNVETLDITAPELKSLIIKCIDGFHVLDKYDYQIVVDAPKLEVLKYACYMAKGYSFKNLNSLSTAYIEVDLQHVDRNKVKEIRENALHIVKVVANAKIITFTGVSLDFLSFLNPTALPVFNKCTELVLGANKYCAMLLPKFLKNSPCLQKLVLDQMHKATDEVSRSEDRFSGLPNEVLGHILSYVTTAESVRTSILSKRWLSVWSCVPILDLDDSLLSRNDPSKDQAMHSSFIRFLNKFFNLLKADSLHKLTLKCRKFDMYHVNEWVIAAMEHRVKELDLCVIMNEHLKFCAPLFAYHDLVDLKLGENFVLEIPGEVLLPCLKKLHLDTIEFSDDESCSKLLSGCPVVEHLQLHACCLKNVKTLQIKALALKSLMIQYVNLYAHVNKHDHQVVVDAPNLEVLRLECHTAKGYTFSNINSLSNAYIALDRSNVSDIKKGALELINSIADAKSITLAGNSLRVLSCLDTTALPIFNKCTKLTLGCNKYCAMLLPKFLKNSPCLQNLVLDQALAYYKSGHFVWHDPVHVPKCLLHSLVVVEIRGYNGQSEVLKLVRYLVSNGKVLGEISAGSAKEEHKEVKVDKQLSHLLLQK